MSTPVMALIPVCAKPGNPATSALPSTEPLANEMGRSFARSDALGLGAFGSLSMLSSSLARSACSCVAKILAMRLLTLYRQHYAHFLTLSLTQHLSPYYL